MEKRLLTEKEVADRLGLCVQTLRNWRFEGRGVPYVKLGSAVRYDEADLISYLKAVKVYPTEIDMSIGRLKGSRHEV